ncbi:MAG: hypothetical protein FWD06_03380 [Oscillospiraceae bacterium]|nr:hypothetical protein [Oscillospiraceae bacterium]
MKKLLAILLALSLLASIGMVAAMANYHGVLCDCDYNVDGMLCECDPWPNPDPDPNNHDPGRQPELTVGWWRAIFDAITDPLGTVRDVSYTVRDFIVYTIPTIQDVFRFIGNAFAWIGGLFS